MATVEQLLSQILAELKGIRAALKTGTASNGALTGSAVADDRDLDGDYGNPAVRKDPPRWNAERDGSFVGCTLAECPPEYLDALASFFDWQATKDEESGRTGNNGKPTAPYKRKDAARCRGWAQRKRNGWQPPAPREDDTPESAGASGFTDDDIPF